MTEKSKMTCGTRKRSLEDGGISQRIVEPSLLRVDGYVG